MGSAWRAASSHCCAFAITWVGITCAARLPPPPPCAYPSTGAQPLPHRMAAQTWDGVGAGGTLHGLASSFVHRLACIHLGHPGIPSSCIWSQARHLLPPRLCLPLPVLPAGYIVTPCGMLLPSSCCSGAGGVVAFVQPPPARGRIPPFTGWRADVRADHPQPGGQRDMLCHTEGPPCCGRS